VQILPDPGVILDASAKRWLINAADGPMPVRGPRKDMEKV
jgi:hypothetical protein